MRVLDPHLAYEPDIPFLFYAFRDKKRPCFVSKADNPFDEFFSETAFAKAADQTDIDFYKFRLERQKFKKFHSNPCDVVEGELTAVFSEEASPSFDLRKISCFHPLCQFENNPPPVGRHFSEQGIRLLAFGKTAAESEGFHIHEEKFFLSEFGKNLEGRSEAIEIQTGDVTLFVGPAEKLFRGF